VGGVSLYQLRRWGVKIFRRAPFTPTCGPFLAIKAQNPVAILEEHRKALECMITLLEREAPAICMLPLDRRISDALPFFWHGFKIIPNYTYVLDLSISLEEIKKNMSSERRKNLTKAAKDGVEVRQVPDMKIVRALVLDTFNRQQKRVDLDSMDNILFRYANPANSYAFVAGRGDSPIAASFVVHDGQTAYYLLGGYKADEKHHGAGASTLFAAIQHAREIGLKTFDFEGSIVPAIERYFRGFGGQITPYLTVNKAWLPIEMALKTRPSYRNRF
jgi:hypothetical protein